MRVVSTYQFGQIEIEDHIIYTFPDGVIGFEHLRDFIVISSEDTDPIQWLQSLDDTTICFPVINPVLIVSDYSVPHSLVGEETAFLVVITLKNSNGHMTANLKAPIALDGKALLGKQVIISADKYSTEHPLGAVRQKQKKVAQGSNS